jgi:hypothetical protein
VGIYAVLAILFLRFTRRWAAIRSKVRVIDRVSVPVEVEDVLRPLLAPLGELGFEEIGFLEVISRPDCTMVLAVTRSPTGAELGLVGIRTMVLLGKPRHHPVLSIYSEAASGLSIETNSMHLGDLPENPSGETWCLSGALEPRLLLRFHRAACRPDRPLKRLDPAARGLVEWHHRQEAEAVQHWSRGGDPELNRDGTAWRLTYRAAARLLLLNLPPGQQIRRAINERRLRPILRRAGITGDELQRSRTGRV